MNQKELNQYIDELLTLFNDHEIIHANSLLIFIKEHEGLVAKESPELVLAKMEYRLDLVKQGQDNLTKSWTLTKFGQRVLRHGSWTKYLYNNEELAVKQIESTITTNKLQKVILWFTAIFTLLTLIITGLDYRINVKRLQLDQGKGTQPTLQEESQDTHEKAPQITSDSSKVLLNDSSDNRTKVKK